MKKIVLILLLSGCSNNYEYVEKTHIVIGVREIETNPFIDGIGNEKYIIYLDNGDSIKTKHFKIGDSIKFKYIKR